MNGLYEEKGSSSSENSTPFLLTTCALLGKNAGLHFIAEFRSDRTQHDILKRAKERKLKMYGMDRFTLDEHLPGHQEGFVPLVLGFSHMRPEDIQPAVKRLYESIYGK